MLWREKKDHYTLTEILNRYCVDYEDIAYLAERGQIKVQTWLSQALLVEYELRKVEKGDIVPVQTGAIRSITGYVDVVQDELRKIFRSPDNAEVRNFRSVDGQFYYSPQIGSPGIPIGFKVLEIPLEERTKLQVSLGLKPRAANLNKTRWARQSAGRSNVKELSVLYFTQREAKGLTLKILNAEASAIQAEIGVLPNGRLAAVKSIENNIRELWNKARASSRLQTTDQTHPTKIVE